MTHVQYGERIGKQGKLRLGCSAVIFDDRREKVLLTKRADNGLWCLPGGQMEAGESVSETCQREVLEETGLNVEIQKLIGVYSDPDQLVIYPDGNKVHFVVLSFEARAISGELSLSEETTEASYFPLDELDRLEFLGHHRGRIEDALAAMEKTIIR